MKETSLITGVNGHLGNNLLRNLLKKGIDVRGTVRNLNDNVPFSDLDFTPTYADLMDKPSLLKALKGVDILYQVAAVFKHWSLDPEKDIYEANMTATRNIMEAAAESGVKKIIYVSSMATLNHATLPMTPDNYNPERSNVYYKSKTDSEQLAWELAKQYSLEMVSVLPSSMIGGVCFRLTPSFGTFKLVLNKELFADTKFHFNWVDVKDVAEGCYLASQKGVPGERYLLGTEKSVGLTKIAEIAQELYPEIGIKTPMKLSKGVLNASASMFECISKITKKEPLIMKNHVKMYYNVLQDLDISKSRKVLGYKPKSPDKAIKKALEYINTNRQRFGIG